MNKIYVIALRFSLPTSAQDLIMALLQSAALAGLFLVLVPSADVFAFTFSSFSNPYALPCNGQKPPANSGGASLTRRPLPSPSLSMVLDDQMENRLNGIRRSYQSLTERLADPDVISDSNLLRQVMKDRSQSEEVVTCFDEVSEPVQQSHPRPPVVVRPHFIPLLRTSQRRCIFLEESRIFLRIAVFLTSLPAVLKSTCVCDSTVTSRRR